MQDPQDLASAPASEQTAKVASPPEVAWERTTLEQLVFAHLNEQRSARRWKVGLRVAWLVLLALVLVLAQQVLAQQEPVLVSVQLVLVQ